MEAAYIPAAVRGDIPCWEEGIGDGGPLFTTLACIVLIGLLSFVEPQERVPLPLRELLRELLLGEGASASASEDASVGVTRRTALISRRIAVCFRRDDTGIRCSR